VLRRALERKPSAEVRARVARLLAKLEPGDVSLPSEELISLRALEALEMSGTPAAWAAVSELTKGAPEARLTQEAKASLQRLARRGSLKP
jgi:hypothetical protein